MPEVKIIPALQKKGLNMDEPINVEDYLKYRIHYSHLKRNLVCFHNKIKRNKRNNLRKYEGISFKNLHDLSVINHLLTLLVLKVTHNFEYELKVLSDEIFMKEYALGNNILTDLFNYSNVMNNTVKDSTKLSDKKFWLNTEDSFLSFRYCKKYEWKKIALDQNGNLDLQNPKWYMLMEKGSFFDYSRFYIECIHPHDHYHLIFLNNCSHKNSPIITLLLRVASLRNRVSHQNLILNYFNGSRISNGFSKDVVIDFVNFIPNDRLKKIINNDELSNFLYSNSYSLDIFYTIITKLLLLERSDVLQSRLSYALEYMHHELQQIINKLTAITNVDRWVSDYLEVLKLIDYYVLETAKDKGCQL